MLDGIRKKTADSLRMLTAIAAPDHLAPVRILKSAARKAADLISPEAAAPPPPPSGTPQAARAGAAAPRPAPAAAKSTAGTESEIEAGQLRSDLDGGIEYLLVDVREPEETRHGIIPGARRIPLGKLLERIGELRDEEKPVVVYCAVGNRSAHAAVNLRDRGVRRVYNLAGGIQAWVAAGGEVQVPGSEQPAA
jgi:adenylyltransferase/sulfurtransferase